MSEYLPEEFYCVCHAIHGADWIGSLTARERWLVERYIEGKGRLPGHIVYVDGRRAMSEIPRDPALLAEVERAADRHDWLESQYEAVFAWFDKNNLDFDSLNREAFRQAFEREFPSKASPARILTTASDSGASHQDHPADAPAATNTTRGARLRGRRGGQGAIDDTASMRAMLNLLAEDKASSVHDAAQKVVAGNKAIAGASDVAKTARLRAKFSGRHGIAPPSDQTWADVRNREEKGSED